MEPNNYTLQIWEEKHNHANPVCVSLEDPRTGKRIGFTDWDSMITFLNQQIEGDLFDRSNVTQLLDVAH